MFAIFLPASRPCFGPVLSMDRMPMPVHSTGEWNAIALGTSFFSR